MLLSRKREPQYQSNVNYINKEEWEKIDGTKKALSMKQLQKIRYTATRQGIPD